MITHKEISEMMRVNPFGGGDWLEDENATLEDVLAATDRSMQEARDLGIDFEDIIPWATKVIPTVGMQQMGLFGPAQAMMSIFCSALRIGFFLGRGYIEDETPPAGPDGED